MSGVVIVSLLGLSAWGVSAGIRANRRNSAARRLVGKLQAERQPLYCAASGGTWFQAETINGSRGARRPFVVEVSAERVAVHPVGGDAAQTVIVRRDDLRWFGRPKKYRYGTNEIWLHAESGGEWRLIRLRLSETQMRALVRALKAIATDAQVSAYRRRRPYLHAGPVTARPATQDMLGAWTLSDPLALYLTPLYLVLLRGSRVHRVIPLEQVQSISAIDRLDAPGAAGLVRFEADSEKLAFSLDDHRGFASLLGEAARRTLEDPVEWQRKKKKPDAADDEDWDG